MGPWKKDHLMTVLLKKLYGLEKCRLRAAEEKQNLLICRIFIVPVFSRRSPSGWTRDSGPGDSFDAILKTDHHPRQART